MKTLIAILDELMFQLYAASLSIMDVLVIVMVGFLSSAYSAWFFTLLVPWSFYSAMQKVKYSE